MLLGHRVWVAHKFVVEISWDVPDEGHSDSDHGECF